MNEVAMVGTHRMENSRFLPRDLSVWLDKSVLALLVLQAVQSVADRAAPRAGSVSAPLPSRGRTMLSLLTYCHAVGICSAADIARSTAGDDTAAYLSAGARPEIGEIIRWHRACRDLLTACLQKVCLVAWRLKFGSWPEAGSARRIDASFLVQIAAEVDQRLRLAEFNDCSSCEPALVC